MAQSPLIAGLARQVRQLRAARGWSGQRLAEEMTTRGVPWDRAVVANLETGRRRSVSVEEWLTLARLLDVAPIHLLVPVDASDVDEVQATPTERHPAMEVRAWIRGEMTLDDGDHGHFVRHRPTAELTGGLRGYLKWNGKVIPGGEAFKRGPDGELLVQVRQADDTIKLVPLTQYAAE